LLHPARCNLIIKVDPLFMQLSMYYAAGSAAELSHRKND